MAKNKTTMKDIADACGVSPATVSYVINNSEKEHISHETRLKVLETAKRLNYLPNHKKRTMARQKSNLVGIIINLGRQNSPTKKMLYYDLAAELHKQLAKAGYDTVLATTKDIEGDADIIAKRSLDATFIIDVNTEGIRQVTRIYYVPIVFLECEFNDSLFCKIYPNYNLIISQAQRIFGEEHLYLIMEDILNQELKDIITSRFQPEDIFINSKNNDLKEFLRCRPSQKGLILGDLLGLEAERFTDNQNIIVLTSLDDTLLLPDTKVIPIRNKTKAKAAVQMLERLLCLDYDIGNANKLLLNPDMSYTSGSL